MENERMRMERVRATVMNVLRVRATGLVVAGGLMRWSGCGGMM